MQIRCSFLMVLLFIGLVASTNLDDIIGIDSSRVRGVYDDSKIDAQMTTNELIEKHKYPAEVHNVRTEDGYILTLHRIPRTGHQPILLVHGVFSSSASFVIMGPNISLAYFLWDNNYDIWLANTRGNFYSKSHTYLKPTDKQFWNFSFNEIGIYDLPVIIDYIRKLTSFHQLHYIGHSQGATAFFVMASEKPEYNEKVGFMQALAPLGYMGNLQISSCRLWQIQTFLNTMTEMILNHFPAGGSVRQIRHFYQLNQSGKFAHYDYGEEGNYERYDQPIAPEYNLSRVTTPLVIHHGLNDLLADVKDVQRLYEHLKSGEGLHLVPLPDFNHMDFVWATEVRSLVYQRLLKVFKKYERGDGKR